MEERNPKRYARTKLALSLTDTAVSLAAVLLLILTPLSSRLAAWCEAAAGTGALGWLLYAGVAGAAFMALSLPLAFVAGYLLEHRYGLSTQSLGGWLGDQAKALVLAVVLGAPLLLGFRVILLYTGRWWWAASALAAFLLTVLLVRLAPVLLLPIFFRFKPVERPELVAAIREVCEQAGLALEGVYQFDMSRNTKKANAAFTGLGRTKRVILGDTLLESFPLEEIRAVVAHEVGHFSHAHLVKSLVFNGAALFVFFGAAQWAYGAIAPRLGYGVAGDLAGLPLVFLLLGIAGFLFQPVSNALSRAFEREADRYAFAKTAPAHLAAALRRLAAQNLADTQPHPAVEFLFHSHPSVAKRLKAAEAFQG